ncbi:MAG: putative phage abortive infection protein [Bacteroidales bacterium]|nr:putative phage abortive infection protein [Bacteroidales bacterium]
MYKFFKDHISVFFIVFIVWVVFSAFVLVFINGLPFFTVNNVGAYGDSFNILTSLFTGLAFAGVIVSIVFQTQELKDAREEFAGQKDALVTQGFDNKFFQLLDLFNTIRFEYSKLSTGAYEATKLSSLHLETHKVVNGSASLEEFIHKFTDVNIENTNFKYYFINMYQILKYIDKQNFDDKNAKFYTNIIRAQLSSSELMILFYYVYFISKTHGDNFKKLVERYSLFEHLGYRNLQAEANINISNKILLEYDINAFGKNNEIREAISKLL